MTGKVSESENSFVSDSSIPEDEVNDEKSEKSEKSSKKSKSDYGAVTGIYGPSRRITQ